MPGSGGSGGGGFQRWTPSQAPVTEQPVLRGEDFITPKLGSGPQHSKYNVEQLLTIYVSLSESRSLTTRKLELTSYSEDLPEESTRHHLLVHLEGIARQMVKLMAGLFPESTNELAITPAQNAS